MKFKARTKDCRLIVQVKPSHGEILDIIELDRFARGYLRGFLKPRPIKKKLIEYSGPVGVTLQERLQKPITKRDFLFILEQIVVTIQKLRSSELPIQHLVMGIQNVYINEVTKELQFIYFPLLAGQNNTNLIGLIESIVYSVKPADDRDNEFASRFIYFFRSLNPFDVEKVEDFILREDRSVVNTIKKQNAGQSGFMTNKQQHYYEHYEHKQNQPDEEATGLLNDGEATALLPDDNATALLDDEATGLLTDDEETGLLVDMDAEEGTALLTENRADVHYPTLFRVLTGEAISVNKPVFRLGKEKSYVDYFVTNNIAVSRSHADIITRNGQFYIIDLNSKNHTYINDQILPVHCEIEISDGDRLKLGNEEFIFHT